MKFIGIKKSQKMEGNKFGTKTKLNKKCKPKMPNKKCLNRVGTLDSIPGIDRISGFDDVQTMYRDLKRMDSITSIISDISEEELTVDATADQQGANETGDLVDRLHGVDLKDADKIWAKLSESERHDVGQMAQKQNMMAILPIFNPWWENKVQCIEISEVGNDHCSAISTEHKWRNLKHPKIKQTIADFSQISTQSPAPHIENNLKNVLAAYTSTVRFFYGEHLRSAYDAVKYLFVICSSLKSNAIFIDSQLAIEAIRKEARKEGLTIEDYDVQQIQKDIDNITEGPDPNHRTNCYVLAALSDLYRLIQLAKQRSSFQSLRHKSIKRGTSSKTMEIVPSQDQIRECNAFINRFGDFKIVEFISLEKSQISSTLQKVEYFLAYAKKFLTYS